MIKNDLTTATVVKMQAVVYTLVTTGICMNSILNCWAISKFSCSDCGDRLLVRMNKGNDVYLSRWPRGGWSEHFVYEFELWRVVVLLSRTSLENRREKTLQTKVRMLTAV